MLHSANLTIQLVYILGSRCKKRPWSNNNGQVLGVVMGVDLTTAQPPWILLISRPSALSGVGEPMN